MWKKLSLFQKSAAPVEPIQKKMDYLKILANNLIEWEESNKTMLSTFEIKTNFVEIHHVIKQINDKILKDSINIVFTGKTSSGKSSLINTLLGEKVMDCGIGHTTPNIAWISTTDSESHYVTGSNPTHKIPIDLSTESKQRKFHKVVNNNSGKGISESIHVYVSKEELQTNIMSDNKASLIDTPGMDRDIFSSPSVRENLREADAIILVIDIVTWGNNKEIRNLINDRRFIVKPNVIVAVNKCDQMFQMKNAKERRRMKQNLTKEITKLLTQNKRIFVDKEQARKSIYFISAETTWNERKSACSASHLENEFQAFENKVLSVARKNNEEQNSIKANNAAKEYHDSDVKPEISKTIDMIDKIKRKLAIVSNSLEISRMNIDLLVNNKFIQMSGIVSNESSPLGGIDKVKQFLKYCQNSGRSELYRILLTGEADDKINAFLDEKLDEAIQNCIDEMKQDHIHHYSPRLDPMNEESSEYHVMAEDIERQIKELPDYFQNTFEEQRKTILSKKKQRELKAERRRNERNAIIEKERQKNSQNDFRNAGIALAIGGVSKFARSQINSYAEESGQQDSALSVFGDILDVVGSVAGVIGGNQLGNACQQSIRNGGINRLADTLDQTFKESDSNCQALNELGREMRGASRTLRSIDGRRAAPIVGNMVSSSMNEIFMNRNTSSASALVMAGLGVGCTIYGAMSEENERENTTSYLVQRNRIEWLDDEERLDMKMEQELQQAETQLRREVESKRLSLEQSLKLHQKLANEERRRQMSEYQQDTLEALTELFVKLVISVSERLQKLSLQTINDLGVMQKTLDELSRHGFQ